MKVLLLTLVCLSSAQTIDEMCKEVRCRPNKRIELKRNGDRYRVGSGKLPFVYRDDIILLPGDTDYVEFEMDGSNYIKPKLVDYPLYKSKSIQVSFVQDTANNDLMILEITSWLPGTVAYHAEINPFDTKKVRWNATSTCPVDSGTSNYESWPYPIEKIVLNNFHVLKPGKSRECTTYPTKKIDR